MADAKAFRIVVEALAQKVDGLRVDSVVGIEARVLGVGTMNVNRH